ncbi:hypothetical protein [Sphingomonas crocodyli]|uniref:Uncharacterized protein n=1 Tax=Sphingomonas crocodyli TaxID=1979270 RepID=A0A437LXX7_9SPHN|nr:hypothetical protein [Sphingomonas crocodyli]RVT90214.1 hypothetical protein EOD43_18120 [Sphingomonas crocodyli]
MTEEVRYYHRKYLEAACSNDPQRTPVRQSPNKGYIECLRFGWIEQRVDPDTRAQFYIITREGIDALSRPAPASSKLPVKRCRRARWRRADLPPPASF